MKFSKEDKGFKPKETKEIAIDGAVMHKVAKCDTVESIAEEHGVTQKDIKELNRRDNLVNMKIGQFIRIK